MTVESLARVQQRMDLLAPDLHPECPYCRELNAAGSTVCADCGGRLTPPLVFPHPLPPVKDCTCDGEWNCTRCVLYLLDNNLPLEGPHR